jgi:hypothetical protein
MKSDSFHGQWEIPSKGNLPRPLAFLRTTPPQYLWQTHQHDQVDELIARLHSGGLARLFDSDTAKLEASSVPADLFDPEYFKHSLAPADRLAGPWPTRELAFELGHEPYALYNWEIFFHLPMLVAAHLAKAQRFKEALAWMRFVLDPSDNTAEDSSARFWKFLPLKSMPDEGIDHLLTLLSQVPAPGTPERAKRDAVLESINAWQHDPFRPHTVAAYRPSAYKRKAVLQTLDILLAAGDSLFKEDTGESIDEATLHYVTAANILGPRPQAIPRATERMPQTYASMRGKLDEFGNALTEIESHFAFDVSPAPEAANLEPAAQGLQGIGSLYFCVPGNERLLGYWDTVADRLFKVRNSLNFKGTFRQLALYEPPIDPGLLARARAMGVNVEDAVNKDVLLMPVRYQVLAQKASELCQEVRALGNALQTAIERADGEQMEALRSGHAKALTKLAEVTRYGSWQDAIRAREGIEIGLDAQRGVLTYLEQELGIKDAGGSWPEFEDLDEDALTRLRLGVDQIRYMPPEAPQVSVARDLSDSGGFPISPREAKELNLRQWAMRAKRPMQLFAASAQLGDLIPGAKAYLAPFGTGGVLEFTKAAQFMRAGMWTLEEISSELTRQAEGAARSSSYERRTTDWRLRRHSAVHEVAQSIKQMLSAQIRESVARREFEAQQLQSTQAEELERFLNTEGNRPGGKFSNASFYLWLKSELLSLHQQAYDLALDVARKAEAALQFELGNRAVAFIQPRKLVGRDALTAGDKLHLDLKRMEVAYLELNTRELELTKHVSLRQLSPEALLELRTKGECTFETTEALFDIDGPGHYFRRTKSVALTMPSVIGPYASVNCQLTLESSRVRTNRSLVGGYQKDGEDDRFAEFRAVVSDTVASSAQGDSGLFETNLRDERYLPFEGAGVIGKWRLRLPGAMADGSSLPRQFDYDTISDVVLHVRYVARNDEQLRAAVISHYSSNFARLAEAGVARVFSLRFEFPTLWAKLTRQDGAHEVEVQLGDEHLPYWWAALPERSLRLGRVWAAFNGNEFPAGDIRVDDGAPLTAGAVLRGQDERAMALVPYDTGGLVVRGNGQDNVNFKLASGLEGIADLIFELNLL